VDPRRYPATNILWASPECTNHSQARGKRKEGRQPDLFGEVLPDEAAERSQATMMDVPRFLEAMILRGRPYDGFIVEFTGQLRVRYASDLRWNVTYVSTTGAELMPVRRVASMKSIGSIGERAVPRQLELSLDTGVGGRCRSLLEAELDRMRRRACGEKRRQRCGEVPGRKQLGAGVVDDLRELPPAERGQALLGGELVVAQLAAGLEVVRADEEVVIDHAAGRVVGGDDFLVPDVRWVHGDREACLLAKFATQGRHQVLTRFDAAAWCRPYARRLFRHCRVREDEPAQQYAVVLVEHDRPDGPA
jgi:hypothetical protein